MLSTPYPIYTEKIGGSWKASVSQRVHQVLVSTTYDVTIYRALDPHSAQVTNRSTTPTGSSLCFNTGDLSGSPPFGFQIAKVVVGFQHRESLGGYFREYQFSRFNTGDPQRDPHSLAVADAVVAKRVVSTPGLPFGSP